MRPDQPERLAFTLRGFVANWVELAQNRLALLSVETRLEVLRLCELLLYGAIAVVTLALGVGFLAVLLTVLLWDGYRLLVLAIFATLFLTLGVIAAWFAYTRAAHGTRLWGASLDELAHDQERLLP
jgi:uncharacterized membrane protein YqjE